MGSTEHRARLYLVEDQPALLKNLTKALSVYPELEVIGSAPEGEAAIAQMMQARPDVALVDLELPGIDGIEVTRRIKRSLSETEVLILTSFDDEQKVYESIRAGAAGYLVKRVGPDKIRAAIREVLDGGTVIEPIIARRFWNYFQSVQSRPPSPPPDPWGLSAEELDVLKYIAKGLSNAEVSQVMQLGPRTVRTHLAHLYRKMGVSSHVEAVVAALRAGLIEL